MVWESVSEKRVRAHITGRGDAVRNPHRFLPNRPGVGHFENSRRRVKEFPQVREINMRPHMIGAEIVHGIKRSEINLTRDSLTGFDFQRRLCILSVERRYRLTLVSGYLEPKP